MQLITWGESAKLGEVGGARGGPPPPPPHQYEEPCITFSEKSAWLKSVLFLTSFSFIYQFYQEILRTLAKENPIGHYVDLIDKVFEENP